MMTVSLLGLMAGSYENPLDLIVDLPPKDTTPSEESRGSKLSDQDSGKGRAIHGDGDTKKQ